MLKAYKYRLLPDKEQITFINRCIGCARFVYNNLLSDYKQQLSDKVDKPKIKEVTFLKQTYDFLNEVDSLALANAKANLSTALKNFFDSRKGKRKGRKVNFPKNHKKSKCRLSYTTNNQGGNIHIKDDMIKLPKVGYIAMVYHRNIEGNIRSVTVSQERDGTYYVSILTDCDNKTICKTKSLDTIKVVGVDMSYKEFAVDSETDTDEAKPKFIRQYRKSEKRLARLHRRMHKKVKGSNSRNKVRKKVAKLSRKVANQHKDFCHKISKYYATKYDVIVLEDLNMQDLQKRGFRGHGKSVSDLCFGIFKQYLSYKCQLYDSCIMYADKWFASSKTCHECGEKNELLQLSDREWVCPHCGCVVNRDFNAALNLRDYFYNVIDINTAGTAGINAAGEYPSTLRETLMHGYSLKAEAPNFRWGEFTDYSMLNNIYTQRFVFQNVH